MRKYAGILLSSVYKTYVGPLIDSTKCATKGSVLSRNRTKTISPAVSVMGEAAESIWRRVNIAIVESSLHFATIVRGSFMFSFKKKPLYLGISNAEGTKC